MGSNINSGWELFSGISKNFHLASRLLPHDIGNTNMIFYLTLKIADTIEDSALPLEAKKECFDLFRAFLLKDGNIPCFISRFGEDANLTCREKNLIANTGLVLDLFYSIETTLRRSFAGDIREMTMGMEKYLEKRIMTIHDQDDYCHYVAGMVGKSLTDLYRHYWHITARQHDRMLRLSNDFGLLLQKVNIIRGLREDYNKSNENSANRIYAPERLLDRFDLSLEELFNPENSGRALLLLEELVKDAEKHKQPSLEYVKQIPKKEKGIRRFSNVILLTSLKLLDKCRGNYEVFERDVEISLSPVEKAVVLAKSLYK